MRGAVDPHVYHLRYGGGSCANIFTGCAIAVIDASQAFRQGAAVAGAFVVEEVVRRHVLRMLVGGLIQLGAPAQWLGRRVAHTAANGTLCTQLVDLAQHLGLQICRVAAAVVVLGVDDFDKTGAVSFKAGAEVVGRAVRRA